LALFTTDLGMTALEKTLIWNRLMRMEYVDIPNIELYKVKLFKKSSYLNKNLKNLSRSCSLQDLIKSICPDSST